jgi:hypothetical protein
MSKNNFPVEKSSARTNFSRGGKDCGLSFPLPSDRGSLTAADVMAVPAGSKRNKAIGNWCVAVWNAFRNNHQRVTKLLQELNFAA